MVRLGFSRVRLSILFLSAQALAAACQLAGPGTPPSGTAPSSTTPGDVLIPASSTQTTTPSPSPAPAPRQTPLAPADAFQRGIEYFTWSRGEYSSAASDQTLAEVIPPLGATWVAVAFECWQDTIHSVEIQCGTPGTPSPADLAHVIQAAHSLGLRVMLKPHLWLRNDPRHWRGQIGLGADDAWWGDWFASYTQFIVGYASLAEEYDVDYFVVGTELPSTSHRAGEWRAVVEGVRDAYSGPLTYAANHGEEVNVTWWDALDAIGVDAYYPMTETMDPTLGQLRGAWEPIVERLALLSQTWNRPVILTEIGYESLDGANRSPWQAGGIVVDLEEQADLYRAAIDAFSGHDWWRGVFWWTLTPDPAQTDVLRSGFTPIQKPAEDVIRAFFGAAPRPTGTPVPTPSAGEDLVIYDNSLSSGWDDWSWDAEVELASTEHVLNGGAAIEVSLRPFGALSLAGPGGGRSWLYHSLHFHIYHPREPQGFLIVYINSYPEFWGFRQSVSNPAYIEGGQFVQGDWQEVRIPLLDLGARALFSITRITIQEQSGIPQTFLVDEIRLVGTSPDSP